MLDGPEFDMILEATACERSVQLARLNTTFGLDLVGEHLDGECAVCWTDSCRFELIIFSLIGSESQMHRPFTFRHVERESAPGTLLSQVLNTRLRAWDFTTGESYASHTPIVFSFSEVPCDPWDTA